MGAPADCRLNAVAIVPPAPGAEASASAPRDNQGGTGDILVHDIQLEEALGESPAVRVGAANGVG
jgi:hypothetical protein